MRLMFTAVLDTLVPIFDTRVHGPWTRVHGPWTAREHGREHEGNVYRAYVPVICDTAL